MRIRSTKPEFWRSERIASVSWDARLVLKGLESYVDDNGVGKDDLALIVADVFPRDLSRNPTGTLQRVSEAISELSEAGLLWRYKDNGTSLLFVSFWESVQRIEKPSKGRYPRPDGTSDYRESEIREPSPAAPEDSGSVPGALRPGTGEQGNRGTGENPLPDKPARKTTRPTDELWEAVVATCGIDASQLTASGRGAINNALKQLRDVEATPGQVKVRAQRYRNTWPQASLTPSALAKQWAALSGSGPETAPTNTAEDRFAAFSPTLPRGQR